MSTPEERKGMRGHDADGNVRPADDRYDLHKPEDESKVCGPEAPEPKARKESKR